MGQGDQIIANRQGSPARVEGVDFSDVNPVLDDISYPITAEELLE